MGFSVHELGQKRSFFAFIWKKNFVVIEHLLKNMEAKFSGSSFLLQSRFWFFFCSFSFCCFFSSSFSFFMARIVLLIFKVFNLLQVVFWWYYAKVLWSRWSVVLPSRVFVGRRLSQQRHIHSRFNRRLCWGCMMLFHHLYQLSNHLFADSSQTKSFSRYGSSGRNDGNAHHNFHVY